MQFDIPATNEIPHVSFKNGVMKIVGRSIPFDSSLVYNPILKSLFDYSQRPNNITEIHINLEYLNSDSNRSLMSILTFAEKIFQSGNQVEVKWIYDDDMMYEHGTIFQSLLDLPVSLIPGKN